MERKSFEQTREHRHGLIHYDRFPLHEDATFSIDI